MNNERTKKVTYEIDTDENLKISRKVEQSHKPRININIDGDDLLIALVFVTVWLLLVLVFLGMR